MACYRYVKSSQTKLNQSKLMTMLFFYIFHYLYPNLYLYLYRIDGYIIEQCHWTIELFSKSECWKGRSSCNVSYICDYTRYNTILPLLYSSFLTPSNQRFAFLIQNRSNIIGVTYIEQNPQYSIVIWNPPMCWYVSLTHSYLPSESFIHSLLYLNNNQSIYLSIRFII